MKIAVTYDNGEIFQHFGKTESFKVYEVEDNKVVSSEVIGSNGTGHGALAGLLAEQGVNVLICGGSGSDIRSENRNIHFIKVITEYLWISGLNAPRYSEKLMLFRNSRMNPKGCVASTPL